MFYLRIDLKDLHSHEELLKQALVLETYRQQKSINKTAKVLGMHRNSISDILKRFADNSHNIERSIVRMLPFRGAGATLYTLRTQGVSQK